MHRLSSRRPLVAAIGALVLIVVAAALPVAGADARPTVAVTILAPAEPVHAGGEAVFVVVVSGPGAAGAIIDYEAEGGTIMQRLGLTESAPDVATATVWVRRDEPGSATLHATVRDGAGAAASARFAAAGSIQLTLNVDAPLDGAARSWLFEVLDSSGVVVEELVAFTSGDAPEDSPVTGPLPPGVYTVRPAGDASLGAACGGPVFYQLLVPAGGVASATLGETGVAAVSFRFAACPPDGASAPSPTPTQLVAGDRTASPTPLPPAAGAGRAADVDTAPQWVVVVVLLVTVGASGWLVARRASRTGTPSR